MKRATDSILGKTIHADNAQRTHVYECPSCHAILHLRTGQFAPAYFAHPEYVSPNCPLRNDEGGLALSASDAFDGWISRRGDAVVEAFRRTLNVSTNSAETAHEKQLVDEVLIKTLALSAKWWSRQHSNIFAKTSTWNLLRVLRRPEAYPLLRQIIVIMIRSGVPTDPRTAWPYVPRAICTLAEEVSWDKVLQDEVDMLLPEQDWPRANTDLQFDHQFKMARSNGSMLSRAFEHQSRNRLEFPRNEKRFTPYEVVFLCWNGDKPTVRWEQVTGFSWFRFASFDAALVRQTQVKSRAYLYVLPATIGNLWERLNEAYVSFSAEVVVQPVRREAPVLQATVEKKAVLQASPGSKPPAPQVPSLNIGNSLPQTSSRHYPLPSLPRHFPKDSPGFAPPVVLKTNRHQVPVAIVPGNRVPAQKGKRRNKDKTPSPATPVQTCVIVRHIPRHLAIGEVRAHLFRCCEHVLKTRDLAMTSIEVRSGSALVRVPLWIDAVAFADLVMERPLDGTFLTAVIR